METTLPTQDPLITDVRASTWNYLVFKIPLKFYSFTLLLIVGSFIGVGIAQDLRVMVFTISIYAAWVIRIYNRIEAEFMKQFATLNKLDYQLSGHPSVTTGRVLSVGIGQKATSFISGWINQLPYQLFLFTTDVGDDRHSNIIKSTVMEIPLGKNVPNIFAVSLRPTSAHWWQAGMLPTPETEYSLHLEGNFDDYYQIQVDPGEEANAMQIFEPNLMAKLIATPCRFDFELLDQTLFIYAHRFINSKDELDSFYKFGDLISSQVHNEVSIMSITDEAAQAHHTQLWPVGQIILNGLTRIFLSTGVVGLILMGLIALTLQVHENVLPTAIASIVIILIGIGMMLVARQFKR